MATLTEKKITFPLKNCPPDVHEIARKEQLRLELKEDLKLKLEEVYYRIVRAWKKETAAS